MKQRKLVTDEARSVTSREFSAYGHPLKMVTSFKYLGIVISAADYDWLEVVQNILKVHMVWQRMLRIMSREGAILWVSGFFFKSVVQLVLLFGAET